MALVLASISDRVKFLGKDANDQYSAERTQFIKDTVREMTMALDWQFLKKVQSITLTGDWIDLDTTFKKALGVTYLGKAVKPLREEEYFQLADRLDNTVEGHETTAYYRLRYNAGKWQIYFINLPTSGTVSLLYVAFTDDVTTVPDQLEEPIVLGATAKFLQLQEGDDLEVAKLYEAQFRSRVESLFSYMDNDRHSAEPDRVKTNYEIDEETFYRSDT